jgi:hypothetical protein
MLQQGARKSAPFVFWERAQFASQLRALAAWDLRVKPLPLIRLPMRLKPGFRITPTVLGGRAVSKKKARGKRRGTAKKSRKDSAQKSTRRRASPKKKPVDLVQVRENINNLVGESAEALAAGVINVAKAGQLTSAKYLFEAIGLYPATEQTAPRPLENSLAHTLLTRMGLPLDPVICDEEPGPAASPSENGENIQAAMPIVGEEDRAGECEEEPRPMPVESEKQDGQAKRED